MTSVDNDVVLIVDDSKFIAQAYSRVLLGLGYRVLIACDGKAGFFAAESCNPSIILLDILMPDMDGVDVLRTLKQTQSTTDIPVLIISSLSEKKLPNRTLLQDRLSKALASARRQKDKAALLLLDLDRFNIINNSLGHSVGDLLLQQVAERLKRFVREQDTVSRLGGDAFAIVLSSVKDIAGAAIAAKRFMDAMTADFVVHGHSLSMSCSIGISIFPEHGADGDTLIKNADAAMHIARDNGGNIFRFFTEDMNVQAQERLTLETSLRLGLGRNELFLMYQPQMDIGTGGITGLESHPLATPGIGPRAP